MNTLFSRLSRMFFMVILLSGVPLLASAAQKTDLATPSPSAIVTGNSVTVSWGAVTNAAGYEVVVQGGIPTVPNTSSTSVTFSNVAVGSYCVKVRALAAPGSHLNNSSHFSACMPFVITGVAPSSCTVPTVTISATPQTIWPPNNKSVSVDATVTVASNCPLTGSSVTASSSEGTGVISVIPTTLTIGSNTVTVVVEASRNGSGSGRTYDLSASATNSAGTGTAGPTTIATVPHDQRR